MVGKKSIDMKGIQVMKARTFLAVALFTYVFLASEYYFDNSMMKLSEANQVVLAQSYILGASVVGFCIYVIWKRCGVSKGKLRLFFNHPMNENTRTFFEALATMLFYFAISVPLFIPNFLTLLGRDNYRRVVLSLAVFFFLFLGALGGVTYQKFALIFRDDKHLVLYTAMSYTLGLVMQYLHRRFLPGRFLSLILFGLVSIGIVILISNIRMVTRYKRHIDSRKRKLSLESIRRDQLVMMLLVFLLAMIFVTLDNAATFRHASEEIDIGQWPRILLMCGAILAGILFDLQKRRYMNIAMLCISMVSMISLFMMMHNVYLLEGVIIFYLGAGAFSVYMVSAPMISFGEAEVFPELSGCGRWINNLCAIIISPISLRLLQLKSPYVLFSICIIWMAVVSYLLFLYLDEFQWIEPLQRIENTQRLEIQHSRDGIITGVDEDQMTSHRTPSTEELTQRRPKIERFVEEYHFTTRERDVLEVLLEKDLSASQMAKELAMSRAVFYRHLSSMYGKTETTSRVGLIQFYMKYE